MAAAEHKDVVIALLGTSGGLAGLALVFLALVFSTIEGFRPGTGSKIKNRYRRMGFVIFAAFLAGIGTAALATAWLGGHHGWTYPWTTRLFVIQLGLTALGAGMVTYDALGWPWV